jgi:hypothetical protein
MGTLVPDKVKNVRVRGSGGGDNKWEKVSCTSMLPAYVIADYNIINVHSPWGE